MITLRPQWILRQSSPAGKWTLTSDDAHLEVTPAQGLLLQKLTAGAEVQDLTDDEFGVLEDLSNRGFLTAEAHPDAPAWELSGANFHSVTEQFKHNTFNLIDLTNNRVGTDTSLVLTRSGMIEDPVKPRLTIVVVDSFQKIPNLPGNVLPVVCNRMRVTIGPMVFPWSPSLGERVLKSEHYLPEPNYILPYAFDLLQRAWIAASILQFVGSSRLRYVGNFVEYNMGKQEFNIWPMN